MAEGLRGISADSLTPPPAHAARPRARRAWAVAAAGFVESSVFDAVFTSPGGDRRSIAYPVYTYFTVMD